MASLKGGPPTALHLMIQAPDKNDDVRGLTLAVKQTRELSMVKLSGRYRLADLASAA